MRKVITRDVEVELDIEDVLNDMTDEELAEYGLVRTEGADSVVHMCRDLAAAVNRGDTAERDRLIDQLCWEVGGVMALGPLRPPAQSLPLDLQEAA